MILTCPSCATRYQADEAKFPADGRQVRCAKCGQTWHQPGPVPDGAAQPEPEIFAPEPETVQAPVREPESAPGPRGFASMAHVEQGPRMAWLPMLGVAAGWAGLIAVVLLIGLSAVRYRQEITVIWPQSAGVYSSLGMNVNAHGVSFTNMNWHRESEDGQVVLVITGAIINNNDHELPVPQTIIVSLVDANNHELYRWPLKPGALTLKPKQSVPLLTRLSSPPSAARHVVVSFAKDGK